MAATDWRFLDVNAAAYDDRLLDAEVTDAYNRFARRATVSLDDPDGTIPAEYPFPTKVEIEAKRDIDGSYTRLLGGFVAAHESERETTTLVVHSHDQWLKRADPVFRDYSSTAISSVISDLITEKTPLSIDEITVTNDATIDASWNGESLENVLDELAAFSAGEAWGATDTAGFYFRPREQTIAPRNFTAGEHIEASFGQDNKREVNRVTVYYGGTSGDAVQVNDAQAQKNLQDELGTSDPVVVSAPPKSFPDITTEAAAERKAEQILTDRSGIESGSLTTWEAFDCEPGQVARVVVPEQDVDGDYVIAELTWRLKADETAVKLAANTQGVIDQLVALSDDVQRIDNRAANPDATVTRMINLPHDIEIALSLEVFKRTVPGSQFLFGPEGGGLGDPDIGGGFLGDQRGDRQVL